MLEVASCEHAHAILSMRALFYACVQPGESGLLKSLPLQLTAWAQDFALGSSGLTPLSDMVSRELWNRRFFAELKS